MPKFTARLVDKFEVTDFGNVDVFCEDISDGHHTFTELYEHSYALFIALCKIYDNYITPLNSRVQCWKSLKHDDGTMFPGQFLLGMSVTQFTGPRKEIAYHLPMKLWDKINVIILPYAPKFSGYTPNEVIRRLYDL